VEAAETAEAVAEAVRAEVRAHERAAVAAAADAAAAVDAHERVALAAVVAALAGVGRCWRQRRLAVAWRRWQAAGREGVVAALQERRGEEAGELDALRGSLREAQAAHRRELQQRASEHRRELRALAEELAKLKRATGGGGSGGQPQDMGEAQLTLTMHKVQAEMYRHFVTQALARYGGRGVLALGQVAEGEAAEAGSGQDDGGSALLTCSAVPATKKVRARERRAAAAAAAAVAAAARCR
jgi:hypothetical protein